MSAFSYGYEELVRAGKIDTETAKHVLELLVTYDHQRHNDGSAVLETFMRLVVGHPLTPLTGADDEWEPSMPGLLQNKRCPHVFKDEATGATYDSMAFVFENPISGQRLVDERSRLEVTFPYYPRARIVQMTPPGGADETLPVAGQPAPEDAL